MLTQFGHVTWKESDAESVFLQWLFVSGDCGWSVVVTSLVIAKEGFITAS